MRIRQILFLAVAWCICSYSAAAAELELFAPGKILPVVMATDAFPNTVQAGQDLITYLEKISGQRPQLLTGANAELPAAAIWIGAHPALPRVFPGVDLSFQYPEETRIYCDGKNLLIIGKDVLRGQGKTALQRESGTANAIYTFLQDDLGVRWLWPGELGTDCPQLERLSIAPLDKRYHPQILTRTLFLRTNISRDWLRFQRMLFAGRGSLDNSPGSSGGHGFNDWWPRFCKSNPEYFALQPDGTRGTYPGPGVDNPKDYNYWTKKLCKSNPAVWQQWLTDVLADLERNPNLNYPSAGASDNHNSGVCVCPNCKAWDRLDAEPFTFNWKGKQEEYVHLTDRYVTFWNHLAKMLQEKLPGRDDVLLQAMAYGPSTTPPLGEGLAQNTMLAFVSSFPFATPDSRQTNKDRWQGWSKKAPNMFYRPNWWYFGGGVWCIPEIALQDLADDFHFLGQNSCMGLFVDGAREAWSTAAPMYYLLAQLTWNCQADEKAILKDYYQRGFGPAAAAVEEYWQVWEDARRQVMAAMNFPLSSRYRLEIFQIIRNVYSGSALTQADACLKRAEAAAAQSELYRQRVAFVRAGWTITDLMFKSADAMDTVRKTSGTDKTAVAKSLECWQQIKDTVAKHPNSLELGQLMHSMQGKKYMGNMENYFGPPSLAFQNALDASIPVKPSGKEWELVYNSDFSNPAELDKWQVTAGIWEVSAGALRCKTDSRVLFRQSVPGYQRIEFTAQALPEADGLVSDLSVFLQVPAEGDSLNTGYFFQFGGMGNTLHKIIRKGNTLWEDNQPQIRITAGQKHQIVVENDEGLLRLSVDGKELRTLREKTSLTGKDQDRVGFYFYSPTRVEKVKILYKPLDDGLI